MTCACRYEDYKVTRLCAAHAEAFRKIATGELVIPRMSKQEREQIRRYVHGQVDADAAFIAQGKARC